MTKNRKNQTPTSGGAAEPTTLASLLVALDHAVGPSAKRPNRDAGKVCDATE